MPVIQLMGHEVERLYYKLDSRRQQPTVTGVVSYEANLSQLAPQI